MFSAHVKKLVKTKRRKARAANKTCEELNLLENLKVSSSEDDQKDNSVQSDSDSDESI